MKFIKNLAIGAIAALCLGSAAQAQTVYFRITGSTAFKAQVHLAIMHALGSSDGASLPAGSIYAYSGSAGGLGSANVAVFSGSMSINSVSTPVIIKTSWSGSEAGIQSVAYDSGNGLAVNYLYDPSPTGDSTHTAASSSGTPGAPDVSTSSTHQDFTISDACMSDTLQSTSQFFGGNTVGGHTYASLSGVNASSIGITYFAFFGTPQAKADGITNITAEQALTLFTGGKLPLSFLVPTTTQTTAQVFAFGRNPDSGTRLTTMGEIGNGNLGTVKQYYPYDSTSTQINGNIHTTWSYVALVPPSTVNGIQVPQSNGGYSSGGNLAKSLDGNDSSFRTTSTSGPVQPAGSCGICYASISDGGNLGNDLGTQLNYNGVAAIDKNVENGTYPLWTYEHMYLSPKASANTSVVANAVAAQLQGGDATGTGCLSLGAMQVQRTGDGGSQITSGGNPNGNGN